MDLDQKQEQKQKQEQEREQEGRQRRDYRPHRDLIVWQRSVDLVIQLYSLTKGFPRNEDFGLTSQIRRAGVSVPSNISEGMTRRWPKERAHFLNIAQGSLSELDTQIEVCRRLHYIQDDLSEDILGKLSEIQRLLGGLIRSVRG
jgi:four helix bundle protein